MPPASAAGAACDQELKGVKQSLAGSVGQAVNQCALQQRQRQAQAA